MIHDLGDDQRTDPGRIIGETEGVRLERRIGDLANRVNMAAEAVSRRSIPEGESMDVIGSITRGCRGNEVDFLAS